MEKGFDFSTGLAEGVECGVDGGLYANFDFGADPVLLFGGSVVVDHAAKISR
jgi:hypothetical protein